MNISLATYFLSFVFHCLANLNLSHLLCNDSVCTETNFCVICLVLYLNLQDNEVDKRHKKSYCSIKRQ